MKVRDLPIEIQKVVKQRQIEQGNIPNIDIDFCFDKTQGNITYSETLEGHDFWKKIGGGDYREFYKNYPKKRNNMPSENIKGNGEIYPSEFGYKIGDRIITTSSGCGNYIGKKLGNYLAKKGDKGTITGFDRSRTEILYDNGEYGYRNESYCGEYFDIIEEEKPTIEPQYDIY